MGLSLRGCKKIGELLPWYVNGTLVGTELAGVERHLHRCRSCRAEVGELRKLQAGLAQALEELRPTQGLRERTTTLLVAEAELETQLLKLLALPQGERQELRRLNFGLFVLGFSLGVAYERGRLPFEAELSALGLPLARFKGRI